ncbi:TonB-dependent receptor plug domain-containing protein [Bisgaard Taxon 45]
MKSYGFTMSIAALCVCFAVSSYAEKRDVFTLGTIYVAGDSFSTEAEKLESKVSRKEVDLFENKDMASAVSRVPGVLYHRLQGPVHRQESGVTVRGFGMRYVPIYVDNIPVYIPYDGYSDLARFTTADLSEIQVAKGYSSVLYGHNAMGGVINITTLKPRSEFDLTGTMGYGSGNTRELSANIGSLQKNWYVQLGASHLDRDYVKLAGEGTDIHNEKIKSEKHAYFTQDRRVSAKLGYMPNDTDEYVFSYSKQMAEKYPRGVKGGFIATTSKWTEWNRETLSFVSHTEFLGGTLYVKPRVYYDKFKNTLVDMRTRRGFLDDSYYDDSAFGASLEIGTRALENHLIKGMISHKEETHRSYDKDRITKAYLPKSETEATQKFLSIALEDTIKIGEKLEWQLGGLYTRRTAEKSGIDERMKALIDKYPQVDSMLAPTMHAWDLQTALFYKPTESHRFHASIAKRTRFPSFKEAYSNYSAGNSVKCPKGQTGCKNKEEIPAITVQNPGLAPEKAIHYEIGYQGNVVSGLDVGVNLFLNRAKNAIERTDYDYNSFPGYAVRQNINIPGTIERKGIELNAQYDINEIVTVGGAYTYLKAKNKDVDLNVINTPTHFGHLYTNIKFPMGLSITPSMEARSSSYANLSSNEKNSGYAVYNMKVSYTPIAWQTVTFNVGVENIFNKNYARYNAEYPSPGRYFYANVRVDFH